MPRGDRTGPLGMGPMTGRGAGYCANNSVPGYMNPTGGRGFGRGFGRGGGGFGWRHRYFATAQEAPINAPGLFTPAQPIADSGTQAAPFETRKQELDTLKSQADSFADALEALQNRISELEKKSGA